MSEPTVPPTLSPLGTLEILPAEIRARIYEFYFAERKVKKILNDNWDCVFTKKYHRDILLACRTVHDEAKVFELRPGLTLSTDRFYALEAPQFLRSRVTTLSITYDDGLALEFDVWPVLKEVILTCDMDGFIGHADWDGYDARTAVKEILKGNLDESFVKGLESIYMLVDGPSLDVGTVPNGVKVTVSFGGTWAAYDSYDCDTLDYVDIVSFSLASTDRLLIFFSQRVDVTKVKGTWKVVQKQLKTAPMTITVDCEQRVNYELSAP